MKVEQREASYILINVQAVSKTACGGFLMQSVRNYVSDEFVTGGFLYCETFWGVFLLILKSEIFWCHSLDVGWIQGDISCSWLNLNCCWDVLWCISTAGMRFNILQIVLLTELLSSRVSKVKWVHLGLLESSDLRWVFLIMVQIFFITDTNHISFHNNNLSSFCFIPFSFPLHPLCHHFISSFLSQHLPPPLCLLHLPPPRVHQERLAPWASVATPDPQVHPESRDFLAPQGRRAPRETLDPPEAPVKTGPQDWEASPEREDCLEPPWVWPREILRRPPGRYNELTLAFKKPVLQFFFILMTLVAENWPLDKSVLQRNAD